MSTPSACLDPVMRTFWSLLPIKVFIEAVVMITIHTKYPTAGKNVNHNNNKTLDEFH